MDAINRVPTECPLLARAPVWCVSRPLSVAIIHDDRIFRNAGRCPLPGVLPASRSHRRDAAYAGVSGLPNRYASASCIRTLRCIDRVYFVEYTAQRSQVTGT